MVPTELHTPNGISTGSAQLIVVTITDRHTDHRTSVTIGRILYADDADEFVMLTGQIRSSDELTPGERRLLAYLSAAKRSLVCTEV